MATVAADGSFPSAPKSDDETVTVHSTAVGRTAGGRGAARNPHVVVRPDASLQSGEFLAVLGPNGVGKTTLLKVLLGLVPLSAGEVLINGAPPRRGNHEVGYIPQQRAFDPSLPIRARDLVRFGLDGHRLGIPLRSRSQRQRLDQVMEAVGALRVRQCSGRAALRRRTTAFADCASAPRGPSSPAL